MTTEPVPSTHTLSLSQISRSDNEEVSENIECISDSAEQCEACHYDLCCCKNCIICQIEEDDDCLQDSEESENEEEEEYP